MVLVVVVVMVMVVVKVLVAGRFVDLHSPVSRLDLIR